MGSLGFLAAALGTTLAAWGQVALLWMGSRRLGAAAALDAGLLRALPRIVAACAVMGLGLIGLEFALRDWLVAPGLRYVALGILVGAGAGAYGIAVVATGAVNVGALRAALSRR